MFVTEHMRHYSYFLTAQLSTCGPVAFCNAQAILLAPFDMQLEWSLVQICHMPFR